MGKLALGNLTSRPSASSFPCGKLASLRPSKSCKTGFRCLPQTGKRNMTGLPRSVASLRCAVEQNAQAGNAGSRLHPICRRAQRAMRTQPPRLPYSRMIRAWLMTSLPVSVMRMSFSRRQPPSFSSYRPGSSVTIMPGRNVTSASIFELTRGYS